MPEERFDLVAAALRADGADGAALTRALASKLTEALPAHTTVRRGGRLLSREKRVERVEVRLGDESFALELVAQRAEATCAKTVGGVVIRRDVLPLDAWLDRLGAALTAEAQRSDTARAALERLLA